MKKTIALLLGIILCMSMAACSSKKPTSEEPKEETKIEFPITKMPEFQTKDMHGNEVTSDIFSEADLTIVNFWGTFCGPCINEMTELAKWDIPDNVQFIGVMVDVHSDGSDEYAQAEKIIEETGVTYTNIMINQQFNEIYEQLVGVPTTFFVDKEGNIIADPIIGANVVGYKEFVEEYFNE